MDIEIRDGVMSTHTLQTSDLVHSSEELRDENSVIFKLPVAPSGPRITRQAEIPDPPRLPPQRTEKPTQRQPTKQPTGGNKISQQPRDQNEMTREVPPAPATGDESGLLDVPPPKPLVIQQKAKPSDPWGDGVDATATEADDLENIGERTMITGAPKGVGGFMMDMATEDGVDATAITQPPVIDSTQDLDDDDLEDQETLTGAVRPLNPHDDEGPTTTRDFSREQKKLPARRAPSAPAALSAKIHAPAVSELRKPRASRKTPAQGNTMPPPNVLQQIVSSQASEQMPVPRPQPPSQPPPLPPQYPPQPQDYYAQQQQQPQIPGVPPHLQPYALQQGYPPGTPGYGQYPNQQMNPNALYQFQPYGAPTPQPMSLTGQLRLFEADEMPQHYKVRNDGRLKLIFAGVMAISVAAFVTFFIIRGTRDAAPTTGTVHVESVPPGGEIYLDGTHVAGVTPLTIPFDLPVGTRHEIRVELAKHKVHTENVDIPNDGKEVDVTAVLDPITGKLRINTTPPGADIILDGQVRGRTPATINDIDMSSAKKLELRLKDYQPVVQTLTWPASGTIDIDKNLTR
ncbi:MAG: PEGA domain-containing protein [Kofleriaceae bacterium]